MKDLKNVFPKIYIIICVSFKFYKEFLLFATNNKNMYVFL